MAEKTTIDDLLKSMENFISTKSVVGEAIKVGDTTILPLVDVSVGVGTGSTSSSTNVAGGMGLKLVPSSVLVIKDGQAKLVNIKQQDGLTKVLDMVPDSVEKLVKGKTAQDPSDCSKSSAHI